MNVQWYTTHAQLQLLFSLFFSASNNYLEVAALKILVDFNSSEVVLHKQTKKHKQIFL